MKTRFGDLVHDTEARELRRGSAAIPISPKAFELLGLLLESRPKAVSKASIHDRLWPHTFISEATLASVAAELREALQDDARQPRFLRTVRGYGYAFCGAASSETSPKSSDAKRSCRLIWEDREIALRDGDNLLGRTSDAVVWIDSSSVSRRHARIVVDGALARIEDLGSKNGTWARGEKVERPTPLASGDEIRLGTVVMRFVSFEEQETSEMPRP